MNNILLFNQIMISIPNLILFGIIFFIFIYLFVALLFPERFI